MKNLSLGLNAVLTIAVIVLFYLHFSNIQSVDAVNETELVEVVEKEDVPEMSLSTGKIAYLNVDSLQANYQYYEELIDQLKGKQKRYEREIEAKFSAFEKKIKAFQQAAPTMSQFEGQTKQKELAAEEQKLYKLREDYATKFSQEELKLNDEFQANVKGFIKKYNNDKNFELIIGASQMGNVVLDYRENINITDEVVRGLNQQYKDENAVAPE